MAAIPDYTQAPYKMDYPIEAINSYLNRINGFVRAGAFHVLESDPDDPLSSRDKNAAFRAIYGLYTKQAARQLLLSIDASEFCHTKQTEDGRLLYVFCIDRVLYKAGFGDETVRIYVKHDCQPNDSRDVVISLHELEAPILQAYES